MNRKVASIILDVDRKRDKRRSGSAVNGNVGAAQNSGRFHIL